MDRNVTNEEINVIQDNLRDIIQKELGVELR
jgi:phenylalanyl-tRNA synthetase beta subunit